MLESRVDDLEQYTRIDNLIISGLGVRHTSYARAAAHGNARETPDAATQEDLENVEDQVVRFFASKGINVDKREISACHLLKAKNPTDKPPIIVRFVNRKSKVKILKNGRMLKGTNVYVNDHLSKKNADMLVLPDSLNVASASIRRGRGTARCSSRRMGHHMSHVSS